MNSVDSTSGERDVLPLRRVLVIGGGGFLGRNLIETLTGRGMDVRCVDLVKPRWSAERVEFHEADFCSKRQMEELFDSCDAVFHLASTTLPKSSNDDPGFDVQTNLAGTVGLLELAVEKGLRKFVFVSSGGTVYGVPQSVPVSESHPTNPSCSYGIVKLAIEKYLKLFHHLYGLNTTSLRLSNPYGEHQRVDRAQGAIAVFCAKALRGEPLEIWGDGSTVRDFIYVKDAVEAMARVLDADCSGLDVNVGSGRGASLNDVIGHIEQLLGRPVARTYRPARNFDVPATYLDIERANTLLNWHPETGLEEGIARLLGWLERQT